MATSNEPSSKSSLRTSISSPVRRVSATSKARLNRRTFHLGSRLAMLLVHALNDHRRILPCSREVLHHGCREYERRTDGHPHSLCSCIHRRTSAMMLASPEIGYDGRTSCESVELPLPSIRIRASLLGKYSCIRSETSPYVLNQSKDVPSGSLLPSLDRVVWPSRGRAQLAVARIPSILALEYRFGHYDEVVPVFPSAVFLV
jgi:hypothetical protein